MSNSRADSINELKQNISDEIIKLFNFDGNLPNKTICNNMDIRLNTYKKYTSKLKDKESEQKEKKESEEKEYDFNKIKSLIETYLEIDMSISSSQKGGSFEEKLNNLKNLIIELKENKVNLFNIIINTNDIELLGLSQKMFKSFSVYKNLDKYTNEIINQLETLTENKKRIFEDLEQREFDCIYSYIDMLDSGEYNPPNLDKSEITLIKLDSFYMYDEQSNELDVRVKFPDWIKRSCSITEDYNFTYSASDVDLNNPDAVSDALYEYLYDNISVEYFSDIQYNLQNALKNSANDDERQKNETILKRFNIIRELFDYDSYIDYGNFSEYVFEPTYNGMEYMQAVMLYGMLACDNRMADITNSKKDQFLTQKLCKEYGLDELFNN